MNLLKPTGCDATPQAHKQKHKEATAANRGLMSLLHNKIKAAQNICGGFVLCARDYIQRTVSYSFNRFREVKANSTARSQKNKETTRARTVRSMATTERAYAKAINHFLHDRTHPIREKCSTNALAMASYPNYGDKRSCIASDETNKKVTGTKDTAAEAPSNERRTTGALPNLRAQGRGTDREGANERTIPSSEEKKWRRRGG